ncbi:glycosyltransferase involved in cell wall biosynthesis [Microbacterium foliorum]|uniref:Glycosyltransferase involved in cell wall biosynthesis n=1 Tax=Microbacterium foliorum TaxID=104336 RepID=A0ABU1HNU9_9MICO|nr:glycosyltransferase [Microbacterium foliorum]MDR6141014.1 glycosyltransferase involved in cell wall biosynthesis [Microbacterium foliorum]
MTTTVSVCMATYNGARFVRHQLESILDGLNPGDEVVVVDDASTDDTADVVAAVGDDRIRLIRSETNRGYVKAFEAAIAEATGEIIFLSDQDDEWVPGRRALLVEALRDRSIAAGDLVLLPDDAPLRSPLTGRPWHLDALPSGGSLANELRLLAGDAPYYGCAMAFRREARDLILPFPEFLVESHDLWIATVGNTARGLAHVQSPVLRRRLHDANASAPKPRGLRKALQSRWMLLRAWREAARRIRSAR